MVELESKTLFTLPDFTNPAEAARAWADEVEAKQKALEIIGKQQSSIAEKDNLILASNEASIKAGEILVREFVKSVDIVDLGEKQFYQWMKKHKLIMDNRQPYQQYVNRGFFTWKPTEEKHGGEYRYTLRITPRGKVWLAAKYMSLLDQDFT
jgi:anti-repressor protein